MSDEQEMSAWACRNPGCQNILAPAWYQKNHHKRTYCSDRCGRVPRKMTPGFWTSPEHSEARRAYYRRYNRENGFNSNKRRHHMTPELFRTMWDSQGGRCAICHGDMTDHGKSRLEVDHDHGTQFVRGLLCGSCNRGIGSLRDDVTLLRKAVDYLEEARLRERMEVTA